mmetsp:Transcript_17632/g.62059  ORF Transcript_17632/g.62059 Transcript_17632/m.62059 type:complete len:208 (-) Transcript_17632:3576-4199(-)
MAPVAESIAKASPSKAASLVLPATIEYLSTSTGLVSSSVAITVTTDVPAALFSLMSTLGTSVTFGASLTSLMLIVTMASSHRRGGPGSLVPSSVTRTLSVYWFFVSKSSVSLARTEIWPEHESRSKISAPSPSTTSYVSDCSRYVSGSVPRIGPATSALAGEFSSMSRTASSRFGFSLRSLMKTVKAVCDESGGTPSSVTLSVIEYD